MTLCVRQYSVGWAAAVVPVTARGQRSGRCSTARYGLRAHKSIRPTVTVYYRGHPLGRVALLTSRYHKSLSRCPGNSLISTYILFVIFRVLLLSTAGALNK